MQLRVIILESALVINSLLGTGLACRRVTPYLVTKCTFGKETLVQVSDCAPEESRGLPNRARASDAPRTPVLKHSDTLFDPEGHCEALWVAYGTARVDLHETPEWSDGRGIDCMFSWPGPGGCDQLGGVLASSADQMTGGPGAALCVVGVPYR